MDQQGAQTQVDYDALAKQAGAVDTNQPTQPAQPTQAQQGQAQQNQPQGGQGGQIDYDALAKQAGAVDIPQGAPETIGGPTAEEQAFLKANPDHAYMKSDP